MTLIVPDLPKILQKSLFFPSNSFVYLFVPVSDWLRLQRSARSDLISTTDVSFSQLPLFVDICCLISLCRGFSLLVLFVSFFNLNRCCRLLFGLGSVCAVLHTAPSCKMAKKWLDYHMVSTCHVSCLQRYNRFRNHCAPAQLPQASDIYWHHISSPRALPRKNSSEKLEGLKGGKTNRAPVLWMCFSWFGCLSGTLMFGCNKPWRGMVLWSKQGLSTWWTGASSLLASAW